MKNLKNDILCLLVIVPWENDVFHSRAFQKIVTIRLEPTNSGSLPDFSDHWAVNSSIENVNSGTDLVGLFKSKRFLGQTKLSNAQQCSAMLSNAQQCSAMLNNA